jgi:hypothetical protein
MLSRLFRRTSSVHVLFDGRTYLLAKNQQALDKNTIFEGFTVFFSILLQNEINPVAIRKEQEIAIKITREDGARSWVSFDQVKLQSVDNIGRIRYMVVHKPGVSWHGFVDDGGISKKWTKFQFTNFGPEMFTDTGKRRPLHKG